MIFLTWFFYLRLTLVCGCPLRGGPAVMGGIKQIPFLHPAWCEYPCPVLTCASAFLQVRLEVKPNLFVSVCRYSW